MRSWMVLSVLTIGIGFAHSQQTGPMTTLEQDILLWSRFESEVLAEVFPEGVAVGLSRFWQTAEPPLRRRLLELFRQYVRDPAARDSLRREAVTLFGSGALENPGIRLLPELWRLKDRDFARNPHNTGEPDPAIVTMQRALNFYFLGRSRIAEDGYIRPGGETLQALRLFRQEHRLLPAEKTLLDEEVLQALAVYALLSQRPLRLEEAAVAEPPQRAPASQTPFPEMTANSVIVGLNRLLGRDLAKGQEAPDLAIMALQTVLKMWLGPFQPLEVSGRIAATPSDPTLRALSRFQSERGLSRSTVVDARLIEELANQALGFRP